MNLALSLHSVSPPIRGQLIPLAKKFPLERLHAAIREANALQGKPVMIEYLMLAGLNDSAEAAANLIDWLEGLNVHVNLIPYNAIEDAPHLKGTERAGRDKFAGILKHAGIPTTIRYSLGADIAAACGQLVQKVNRAEPRPTPPRTTRRPERAVALFRHRRGGDAAHMKLPELRTACSGLRPVGLPPRHMHFGRRPPAP